MSEKKKKKKKGRQFIDIFIYLPDEIFFDLKFELKMISFGKKIWMNLKWVET